MRDKTTGLSDPGKVASHPRAGEPQSGTDGNLSCLNFKREDRSLGPWLSMSVGERCLRACVRVCSFAGQRTTLRAVSQELLLLKTGSLVGLDL